VVEWYRGFGRVARNGGMKAEVGKAACTSGIEVQAAF